MTSQKILFGQSYFLRFDPKLWAAMMPYPPLGTLYAASYLREKGYEVALFDAMLAQSEDDWAAALDTQNPDYAIIFEDNFNYLSKMCLLRMREAAFSMIQLAKDRGCPVIICGADATDHPEDYLERGADFILIGEGDETLWELLEHLETYQGADNSGTRRVDLPLGLTWLSAEDPGTLNQTSRRSDIKDLDSLPFPAWDLVDVEKYRNIWLEHHGYFSMNMVTTRGCPYHCNWCAKPIWGQRYNVRSPENVVNEIRWLMEIYQPDHIWFADDIFGLKPGWLPDFARLTKEHNCVIPYKCLSRVDLLNRGGEIQALKASGAEIIWVGAESGAQEVLNAMEKGTRIEDIYESSRKLKQSGIRVGLFLQFGYPGESRANIEQTIQMVRDILPDDIGMSVSYPLPGTPFYDRVFDQLGDQRNWYDSQDMAMMYQGPFSTEFYRQLHVVLHKEFRFRRNWQEIKALVRTPRKIQKSDLRRPFAMIYQLFTLPAARRQLNKLEHASDNPIGPLGPGMSLEEASSPSPQN